MSALSAAARLPQALNRRFDNWIGAPEVNAAGRMGLFRILYGVLLLWTGSQGYYSIMAQVPASGWRPLPLALNPFTQALFFTPPSREVYHLLEFALIVSIALLIIGYQVRLATVLVLALGFIVEMLRLSYGRIEHGSVFQVFYIPLVMVFSQWGATHSLDAELQARRTGVRVSPSDSSWRYIWPMRVLLLILSVLFFSAIVWKFVPGFWFTNPNAFAVFLLKENIEVTAEGGYASPLLVIMAQIPLVTAGFRLMLFAFEGLFFTALLSNKLRNLFVSTAIIFHAFNALLAYVSFTYLLIVYPVFADWESIYQRWWPSALKRLRWERFSTPILVGGALASALVFGLLWMGTPVVRQIFSLGGLLDWRTIWLPLMPIGIIGFIRAAWVLLSDGWRLLRGGMVRRPVTG